MGGGAPVLLSETKRTGVERSLVGVLEVARGGVGVAWFEFVAPTAVEPAW